MYAKQQAAPGILTAQSKMIFQPAIILLAVSLSTQSVNWMKKLNSYIFQLDAEEERRGKTIDEEEECRPGIFCMFLEDDSLERNNEDNKKSADIETIVAVERFENNTRVKKIIILIFLLPFPVILVVLYSTDLQ